MSDRCPLGYLFLYVRFKFGVTFVARCFCDEPASVAEQPGPKVIKKFPCSTQLSMKFIHVIVGILTFIKVEKYS